ncbi:hypothetical protein GOP47_0010868 [Adiantum capillus-veneris]|uniref:Uncharacterized protein n=1 Tax=Adiantum capillus-veneris TaxID=13818 RepID=A0A9D4UWW5_ADICA|nr:hypothetical protein GOP47_0010868 [Adiantum capillus-veneris]
MRADELLYECCFPAVAQPPLPLSLAHPLFGEFLDDFSNVSAPLDDDVCNFVVEVCFSVLGRAQVFHNEAEFQIAFNRKMGGFLGHTVAVDMITCQAKKVMTDATVIAGDNWVALGELKLEKGGTLALGLQSFALYVGSLHAETELLPCFFIEVIGATIRIGGLVFFEKVAWQPLTPFMNCFYTEHDRTDMATLCRAMRALKKGLTALHSYYIEAHPSVNTITPKDIPYPLQGRRSVRIGNKLIFIVTRDDGERRIFKYCRQYGEEVHRSWAEAGWAPFLFHCKPIAGGWLEVGMHYLADWNPSLSLLKAMDGAAKHELQVAITTALK